MDEADAGAAGPSAPPGPTAADAPPPRTGRRPRPFTARLRDWHRDIGYLISGLTVTYCVSGIAVNHIDAWNPRYAIDTVDVALGPLPAGDLGDLERVVVERAGIDPKDVRGRFAPSAQQFTLFLREGGDIRVHTGTGRGRHKRVTPRHGLFQSHQLHLNQLKGAWTYVADAFALLLLFLAISGLFLPRGRQGLRGRGGVLLIVGLLVPIAALWALASP